MSADSIRHQASDGREVQYDGRFQLWKYKGTDNRWYHGAVTEIKQPQQEGTTDMNLTTAIFVINDNVRAVMATYEDNQTPTMFKTLDQTVGVDDFIVVPSSTRHKITTCKVTAVDVPVDFNSTTQVQWVLGKVNMADANAIKDMEDKTVEIIREKQMIKKKKEMMEMLALTDDDIKSMPMAKITGTIAAPVPEAVKGYDTTE